ncbi:WXG100-like domain-containing protein [Arthrobacter sp. MDT2-2]
MNVLRIDTDRYAEAAVLASVAARGLAGAAGAASAALMRTGGMAGWDAIGAGWAASYDPAAREVLAACHELALASSDTSHALTLSAGNYILAEHIASQGLSALMRPSLPVAVGEAACPCPPSACDVNPGWPPPCWDIVAGIAGVAWPSGDPEILRSAAMSWAVLADDVDATLDGPASQSRTILDGLLAEDLALLRTRSAVLQSCGRRVAEASRDIATGCASLATAIDQAHQELIDETRSFALECAALAAVGAALSFATLGGSAAITALVGAARTAQMVARVHQVLARLSTLARTGPVVAARIPGATRLGTGLQGAGAPALLRSTVQSAVHSARQALGSVTSAGTATGHLSRLAPAVRILRPIGTAGLRGLDSTAVSVALSSPAALVRNVLSYQVRSAVLGPGAVRGSGVDQALAVLRSSRFGASPVIPAAEAALRTKGRIDTVTGLAALPGSLRDRYSPDRLAIPATGFQGPGRLTGVRGSPGTGPRRVSSRAHRTSRPAASP